MQLGMIGLGRMGGNMVRRLLKGGHQCIVYNRSANAVAELVKEKAIGTTSLPDFVKKLSKPRAVWLMVPTGVVDNVLADLLPHLQDPALSKVTGSVSVSGEGRSTNKAAIDEGVPAHVLSSALYERFSSRGDGDFADKLLSAMRYQLGGHIEKPPAKRAG